MEQLMKKREGQEQETPATAVRKIPKDERFKNTYLRPPKPMTNTPGGLNPFLLSPRI